jgi:hypothetical protein
MGAIRTVAVGLGILIAAAAATADCVTAVRTLSTRASVPNLVAGPSSWTGSSLAVAKIEENVPGAVWVSVYDESLNDLTGDRRVATDARSVVGLAWNGSEHGLFYTTLSDGLFLQRLAASGEPVGERVAITPARLVNSGDRIDVLWSPALNGYVVARAILQGAFRGVWITILEQSGAQRSDRQAPVSISGNTPLELAVTTSGVIGAFFNNSNGSLVFARTGGTGIIEVRVMTAASEFIAAAGHDGVFAVARSSETNLGANTEIRWFVVDTSQQIVRSDARLVAPDGDDAWPLEMISTGEELALSYIDAPRRSQPVDRNFRLLRFEIDGTIISDTPFAGGAFAFTRGQSSHPFAWTGTSYLAPVVHSASDRLNSFLLRYCPLRAEIVAPVRTVRVNTPIVLTSTVSGGVPEYQYAWTFPNEIGPKKGPTHERVFDRPGVYTIIMEVTDSTGAVTRDTIVLNVIRGKHRSVRH